MAFAQNEKKCRNGGHPWVESNIGINSRGERFCRECARAAGRRAARKRATSRPPRPCECGRPLRKRQRVCSSCRSQGRRSYDVRPEDRAYIYARDSQKCLRCGDSDNLTIDHILPRALGGKDMRSNYQTLCLGCNVAKGATYADYRPGANGQLSLALEVPRPSLRDRFMEKVEVREDGCWGWTGARVSTGSGAMSVEGRLETASRVSWLLEHGEMPEHSVYRACGNDCVNPKHLTAEHPQRREGGFCRNGHEMTPDNTIRRKGKGRRCKSCRRAYQREWARNKAKEQALA